MSKKECLPNIEYIMEDMSNDNLNRLKFKRHNKYPEIWIYKFPLDKYKDIVVLYGTIRIDTDEKTITLNAINPFGDPYHDFYCSYYGNSEKYINKINRKFKERLRYLGIKRKTNE